MESNKEEWQHTHEYIPGDGDMGFPLECKHCGLLKSTIESVKTNNLCRYCGIVGHVFCCTNPQEHADKAREEGMNTGLKSGWDKGFEEGIAQGRQEAWATADDRKEFWEQYQNKIRQEERTRILALIEHEIERYSHYQNVVTKHLATETLEAFKSKLGENSK